MSDTRTDIPTDEPIIIMKRLYEAPRDLVWQAMTEARHLQQWWGGAGVTNPVCEMDVRRGGLWNHVMRFPDGRELNMKFVFVEVDRPARLVWEHAQSESSTGLPAPVITVTLDELDCRTAWTMTARFRTLSEREAALSMGFTRPIEASGDRLVAYLKSMSGRRAA
jgi:uncharacterized protein YndB with AHSA1/START domain